MDGVYVPEALRHINLMMFEIARACRTQDNADRIVEAVDVRMVRREAITKVKGVRGDQQVAGTYSLDLCQGGGRYHECSPDERGSTRTPDKITGGVATVRHMPKKLNTPHHRIYPKCYLPTK